jgi:beta-aspartyl-peptidase (threonine type)
MLSGKRGRGVFALVVHGGAGSCPPAEEEVALAVVTAAAEAGRRVLAAGGGCLDAVTAAVVVLEDDRHTNAGTGSVLNIDGEAEMDAGVMIGAGLRTGNVAALRRVKNPVLIARAVMEQSDHVLLSGAGAERFARALGHPDYDPVIPERREGWRRAREGMERQGDYYLAQLRDFLASHAEFPQGTVGAVALDAQGRLAAATSTGGVTLKLPGRIGDSPVPGAGNYATPAGGASATGKGELMLRFLTTRAVCERLAAGEAAQRAVEQVLAQMAATVGSEAGIIAVDGTGGVGVAHLTAAMPHAFVREGEPVVARIRVQV